MKQPRARKAEARAPEHGASSSRRGAGKSKKAKPLPREKCPKATGRPPLDIDAAEVQRLVLDNNPTEDIALILGCSPDTLERRFAGEIAKGRAQRRANIRAIQTRMLEEGNPTMAVWLGKNELGQTDKSELTGANGAPLFVRIERVIVPAKPTE